MHNKRAEHWVVVIGTATVINNEEILTLTQGQSTYISLGVKHSLANQTNEPLEIIEVQSGTYLGEDDIVRVEPGATQIMHAWNADDKDFIEWEQKVNRILGK